MNLLLKAGLKELPLINAKIFSKKANLHYFHNIPMKITANLLQKMSMH